MLRTILGCRNMQAHSASHHEWTATLYPDTGMWTMLQGSGKPELDDMLLHLQLRKSSAAVQLACRAGTGLTWSFCSQHW